MAPADRGRPPWWSYPLWFAVGALGGLGVLAILTIGVVLLLAAVVLGGLTVAATRLASRADPATTALRLRSVVALPAGVAVPVAYLAWLDRHGPGTYCHAVSGGTECDAQWSPWPFVAVAVLLVASSVLLARVSVRRRPVR